MSKSDDLLIGDAVVTKFNPDMVWTIYDFSANRRVAKLNFIPEGSHRMLRQDVDCDSLVKLDRAKLRKR